MLALLRNRIEIQDIWNSVGTRTISGKVILKTGDQCEVHVRFDETLNAAELINFVM